MPEVSVIVPIYDCEPYLRACIDSILSQTFRDFELILVDDGSPDSCGEIIDGYAARDGRITVIHKENGGQSSARNAGLEAASGTFVYFPDSDDVLAPDLLETVIPRFRSGFEMVAFCFEMIPRQEKPDPSLVTVLRKDRTVFLDTDEEKYAFLTGPFRRKAIRWEVWNRVYRRDIIERWHIRFPHDRGVYPEDMYFNYCYVAHASRILMIPDVLYRYRIREGSVSDRSRRDLMIRTSHLLAEALREHYGASSDCGYLAEHFLPLYYLLHKGALRRLRRFQWRNGMSVQDARSILRDAVTEYSAFRQDMISASGSPAVRRSYRQDRDALLQLTDRLYAGELLEFPASPAAVLFRRGLLRFLRAVSRK